MTSTVALALLLALIAANGLFVAAEFSMVAARRGPIEELALRGDGRARATLAVMSNLSFMLSGAQFGITASSLLVGFLARPAVADLLAPVLRLAGAAEGTALAVSVSVAFLLATAVQMVVGELAPKNLAIARPERVALAVGRAMQVYGTVLGPVVRFFDRSAAALSGALGVEQTEELLTVHSRGELARIIAASGEEGSLTEEQAELLLRAVELGDRRVSEVMVPRPDVVWLRAGDPLEALRDGARRSGFSRFPVRDGEGGGVVGTVHLKDLLRVPAEQRPGRTVGDVASPPLVVPESHTLRRLLAELRAGQRTFGVVVDEFGEVAGIVTLEDVLEQLVGDIQDEFDRGAVTLRRAGPGRYLVAGSVRVDRLEGVMGLSLPEGEYETVAGFVMDRLGRLPRPGDRLEHEGVEITVWRMEGHRVVELLLRRVPRGGPTGGDATESGGGGTP